MFMENCDAEMVRERIEQHILTKRRLHLLNLTEEGDRNGVTDNMARLHEAKQLQQQHQQLLALRSLDHSSICSSGRRNGGSNNQYISVKVVQKVKSLFLEHMLTLAHTHSFSITI